MPISGFFMAYKSWRINTTTLSGEPWVKVTQVPCSCGEGEVMKAPDGCLQHHTGISGGLKSFNYDGIGCFSNDHICDPDNLDSCEFVAGF